jgi:glycosyltransferase involved in cell wall biosynthesis
MIKNNIISILIVAYNSWDYIIHTLKSCLDQTYQNFEILILDNNSTDNTLKNIHTFKDKRIKLFTSDKNIGPFKWLNFLLDKVKSEYVAIQDHDDIWHPEKLQRQINILETHKKYVWCWTMTQYYYEIDKKYYLIYNNQESKKTTHTSLVFRYNKGFLYDTSMNYLCDPYTMIHHLCKNKKLIYNIKIPLTLHLIKWNFSNAYYLYWIFSFKNIKRIVKTYWFSMWTILQILYEFWKLIFMGLYKLTGRNSFMMIDRLQYIIFWSKKLKIYEKYTKKMIYYLK